MKKNTEIKTISEKLFSAERVVLFPHVNPDGDCTGACAALSLALRAAGVECTVCSDQVPDYLQFIDLETFADEPASLKQPYISVAVDCNMENRMGDRIEAFRAGSEHFCIDHHASEDGFGEFYYIDEDAAAASEIIFEVLKAADVTFTRSIANAIYTGIITDTGGFRYSNTTAHTHDIASELLRIGVDHIEIMVNLFNNKSLKKVRCESKAIGNMLLFADGKGAISYLTSGEMAELDAQHEDADEIIDRLRDIEGVEMAAYLEEREEGIKVSMRAKTDSSVLEICARNGGGGHVKAAGCTMYEMTMEHAFAVIKGEMEDALRV